MTSLHRPEAKGVCFASNPKANLAFFFGTNQMVQKVLNKDNILLEGYSRLPVGIIHSPVSPRCQFHGGKP